MNRIAWSALCLAACLGSERVAAQVRWAVDRYHPTPAGDVFTAVDHPRYGGAARASVAASLRTVYALEPHVARPQGAPPRPVIDHSLVAHLGVAVRFLGRVEFDVALPVSLVESGGGDATGPRAFGAPAAGDLRLGARLRLWGDVDRPLSLHVGVQLFAAFLGTAPAAANTSDGWTRGRVTLIAAGRAGALRWSFTAGAHARPTTRVNDAVVAASEMQFGLAAGVSVADDRVIVGPEFWFATPFADPFRYGTSSLEAQLGARVQVGRGVALNVSAGPGLLGAAGVPNLRGALGLTWQPSPAR